MFRFFIILLALPAGAYEREEEPQLPSSPIRVYENSEEEKPAGQTPVQMQREQVIIREQPPIQVYSAPLTPQEKLTRARKQAEEQTENKLKTRLELLRLKDEKARMDKLLSPFEDQHISVPEEQGVLKPEPSVPAQTPSARKYFLHLGLGRLNHYNRNPHYPESIQRLGASLTGGLGLYESQKLSIEYTYSFSKHRVVYAPVNPLFNPTHTRFDLHSHSLGLKYYVLSSGLIRPFLGGVASLNIRSYTTEVAESHRYDPFYYWNERASRAFQGAFVTGAELFITQNFVLGLDLRLYMNIYDLQDMWVQKTEQYYYYTVFETTQPLPEEMSWYNLQGFVRFLF